MIVNILIAFLATATAILSVYEYPKNEKNTSRPKNAKKVIAAENTSKKKRNALILMAILTFVLAIIDIIIQKSVDKVKDNHAASLMQKISNLETSNKEIVTTVHLIRDYQNSGVNKFGDSIKVGRTIYGVYSINSNTSKSKAFLFDIGYHENRSRVSIYVNEYSDLIYRIIGDDGTMYSIKVPLALNSFELNRAYS